MKIVAFATTVCYLAVAAKAAFLRALDEVTDDVTDDQAAGNPNLDTLCNDFADYVDWPVYGCTCDRIPQRSLKARVTCDVSQNVGCTTVGIFSVCPSGPFESIVDVNGFVKSTVHMEAAGFTLEIQARHNNDWDFDGVNSCRAYIGGVKCAGCRVCDAEGFSFDPDCALLDPGFDSILNDVGPCLGLFRDSNVTEVAEGDDVAQ